MDEYFNSNILPLMQQVDQLRALQEQSIKDYTSAINHIESGGELHAFIVENLDSNLAAEQEQDKQIFEVLDQLQGEIIVFQNVAEPEWADWEEASISDHKSDSGFGGSASIISDLTEFSFNTEELPNVEQNHQGTLVVPELLEENVKEDKYGKTEVEVDSNSGFDWQMRSAHGQWFAETKKRKFDEFVVENMLNDYKKVKIEEEVRPCFSEVCISVTHIKATRAENHVRRSNSNHFF